MRGRCCTPPRPRGSRSPFSRCPSGRCARCRSLLTPLFVWLATPFMRPFTWRRLVWTYLAAAGAADLSLGRHRLAAAGLHGPRAPGTVRRLCADALGSRAGPDRKGARTADLSDRIRAMRRLTVAAAVVILAAIGGAHDRVTAVCGRDGGRGQQVARVAHAGAARPGDVRVRLGGAPSLALHSERDASRARGSPSRR